MKAVILDIDGTLLDSSAVDSWLYISAIRDVLGGVKLREEWATYINVTDSGILNEIVSDNMLNSDVEMIEKVKEAFFKKLKEHIRTDGPFQEIPGARAFVHKLCVSHNRTVAYATGGWEVSARMKLESAGFPIGDIPLASSDQYLERELIMESAFSQLRGPFESVVYYGDAVWDQTATLSLGWKFVAVGKRLNGIESFYESAA